MRVLVTGASGFIGTSLVRRLRAEHMDVRALLHSPEKAAKLASLGAEIVVGDITDATAVRAAVNGSEIVFHLAGRLLMPGVPASEYWRTHLDGTQCVLDACHADASFQRFIL
ncbi:MAG TPA: NAD-dependent epimerase/dehydratase family protein, partial [Chloroflexota bacterium]|nr:NAD-dependent epimerase/dehydratase family protein [Chloroflexota bacterium]